MEHATIAANQGLSAVEEIVAAGAHSGTAAVDSQQKAIEINTDLTRIIHGCTELTHKLGLGGAVRPARPRREQPAAGDHPVLISQQPSTTKVKEG